MRKSAIIKKVVVGVVALSVVSGGLIGCKTNKASQKETEVVDETEEAKETVEEVEEKKESFTLSSEQIQKIEGAARLFDELQCEYLRENYTLDLTPGNISAEVLNNAVAGIVCADDNLGTLVNEDEFQKKTETLSAEKCTELLEKTFGYTEKEAKQSETMLTSYSDTEYAFEHEGANHMTSSYTGIYYTADKFVQTAENEYHFYVTVTRSFRVGQPDTLEGVMDIKVYKNEESRFGGFVFEAIDFEAYDDIALKRDYESMVGDMITAKTRASGNLSNPVGIYDVNQLSGEEFEKYAMLFIENADCTSDSRKESAGSSVQQCDVSKTYYEDISKNTLGRKDDYGLKDDVVSMNWEVEPSEMKYWTIENSFYQDLNGVIRMEGKIAYFNRKDSELDQYDTYLFTASGYVDDKSRAGYIIDKVEVMADTDGAWRNAYIEWVNTWNAATTFELIDVNGDEIPEIVAIGKDMAHGTTIATYGKNGIQEVEIYRCEAKYLPGKNRLDNSGGSMDMYQDRIFKIENGNWVQLADGKYGFINGTPMRYDENDEPIYKYEWNGKEVTQKQYQQEVKKLIDLENANEVAYEGATAERIKSSILNY